MQITVFYDHKEKHYTIIYDGQVATFTDYATAKCLIENFLIKMPSNSLNPS